MKTQYFHIDPRQLPGTVTLDYASKTTPPAIAYRSANFVDFWYQKGSKFTTFLESGGARYVCSQAFKDAYDNEGWKGLEFKGPIIFHDLRPNLFPPMPYYSFDVFGRCDRVIAHNIFKDGRLVIKSGWEVVNDNGNDFMFIDGYGAVICSSRVHDYVLKAKFTNIHFEDFDTSERLNYPGESPAQSIFEQRKQKEV